MLKNPGDFLVLFDPNFEETTLEHDKGAYFMWVRYEPQKVNDSDPFWKFRFGNIKKQPNAVTNIIDQYLQSQSFLVEVF